MIQKVKHWKAVNDKKPQYTLEPSGHDTVAVRISDQSCYYIGDHVFIPKFNKLAIIHSFKLIRGDIDYIHLRIKIIYEKAIWSETIKIEDISPQRR